MYLFALRFQGQQMHTGRKTQVIALLGARTKFSQSIDGLLALLLPVAAFGIQPFGIESAAIFDKRCEALEKIAAPKLKCCA